MTSRTGPAGSQLDQITATFACVPRVARGMKLQHAVPNYDNVNKCLSSNSPKTIKHSRLILKSEPDVHQSQSRYKAAPCPIVVKEQCNKKA